MQTAFFFAKGDVAADPCLPWLCCPSRASVRIVEAGHGGVDARALRFPACVSVVPRGRRPLRPALLRVRGCHHFAGSFFSSV